MRLNLYRRPSAGWGPASFVVIPKKNQYCLESFDVDEEHIS